MIEYWPTESRASPSGINVGRDLSQKMPGAAGSKAGQVPCSTNTAPGTFQHSQSTAVCNRRCRPSGANTPARQVAVAIDAKDRAKATYRLEE
jgi:hypothetical protein